MPAEKRELLLRLDRCLFSVHLFAFSLANVIRGLFEHTVQDIRVGTSQRLTTEAASGRDCYSSLQKRACCM